MENKEKTGESHQTVKFRTEDLLKSKALKDYQIDFSRALLTEPEYTVAEAKTILDRFFERKVK